VSRNKPAQTAGRGRGGDLLALLSLAEQPVGERVYARSLEFGNRVTATRARMSRLFPPT
jgi:hypothetical protein